jgi:hypothetical protein
MIEIARRVDAPLVANGQWRAHAAAPRPGWRNRLPDGHSGGGLPADGQALEVAMPTSHNITTDTAAMYPFAEFNKLIGFEDVWAFEKHT